MEKFKQIAGDEKNKNNFVLILYNIRSAINVGSIFRTADAVGINKIYLVGCTPAPVDKFNRIQKDITKSALGAEKFVEWESKKNLISLIKKLKKENFQIIAIEQEKRAIDYRKFKIDPSYKGFAFILGEEVNGLDKKILDNCDFIIEILMQGQKESLNVSVACGVVLFRVLDF
jgi:23S rRNA (guanosine2251-2'-O)-methyltransferase